MASVTEVLERRLTTALEWTTPGYRLALRWRQGVKGPSGRPAAPWHNAVLKTRAESDAALEQVRRLGLPERPDRPKHWDTLGALDAVLGSTRPGAAVLDAGAERYSLVLPWLFLYGYTDLFGINLVFKRTIRRGPIVYSPGDITKTTFPDARFDAITCLSVIEHGVDLDAYFREMARILKPGGLLISSTDYWETPVDTGGKQAYGAPIHIFTADEVETALAVAARHGFEPTGPLDPRCEERVVRWQEFGLDYTFVLFTLRKRAG